MESTREAEGGGRKELRRRGKGEKDDNNQNTCCRSEYLLQVLRMTTIRIPAASQKWPLMVLDRSETARVGTGRGG